MFEIFPLDLDFLDAFGSLIIGTLNTLNFN